LVGEPGMPLYHVICRNCSQPTFLGAGGNCRNVAENGAICHGVLPLEYCDDKSAHCDKSTIETPAPAAGTRALTSLWTWAPDHSARFQEVVMASGSVQLDSASNYFFLWTARGPDPLASLFFATGGSVVAATGVFLALDPDGQNYRPFFSDYKSHLQQIAAGPGLIVHAPDGTHSDFRVYRDEAKPGNLVFLYNPALEPASRSD
jgi:hypothetical protein